MALATLNGFPPLPPEGQVSVCEIDGKVGFSLYESATNPSEFTNTVSGYPVITITQDVDAAAREDARQVFIPVEEKLVKRLVSTWLEQGTIETLKLASDRDETELNPMLQAIARSILNALNGLSKIQNIFSPHIRESGEHLIAAVSQTRGWLHSPVRCMAWHNHCVKLAVAAWDDSVRVYSGTSPGLTPVLRSKMQRSVTCVAWRPNSASELAVGCHCGVLVWQIDPRSMVTRPSASCATVLKRPGHSPVTSVEWNCSGSLLVSSSAADTSMYIWDVDLQDAVPLHRMGGGGISLVLWAPDTHKLFAATSGMVFRVWNMNNCTPERWRVQSGHVRTACWSPCSTVLLFATSEETVVYALHFKANMARIDSIFNNDSPDSNETAHAVINVAPRQLETGEMIGGKVVSMKWDEKGHHLALIFENSCVVVVFRTDISTHLQLIPCCFVKGAQGEFPNAIMFKKNFNEGACLTIAWSSGRVQYFPIIYQNLQGPHSHSFNNMQQDLGSQSVFHTSHLKDDSMMRSFCDSYLSY